LSDNRKQVAIGAILKRSPWVCPMEAPRIGNIFAAIPVSRGELLKRVDPWTQRRKISRGLCAELITTSEAVLANDLAQDEIDRWMEAYKSKDFEALKVGYRRKRRTVGALAAGRS